VARPLRGGGGVRAWPLRRKKDVASITKETNYDESSYKS